MNNRIQGAGLIFTALAVLIAVLIVIGMYSSSDATQFQGIADSTETVINSESSVEIQKILVMEGQKVNAGEKLAELTNPELSLRISDINNQLLQLVSEKGMGKAEIKSKLIQVRAAQQAAVNDLNSQIRSLENQLKINMELSSGLKSIEINKNQGDLKNPIRLQIESLKQEIEDRKKEFGASAQMYLDMLANSDAPVKIQMERLKEELEMLTEKSQNLAVFAPFEGIIGSVFFKGGEKIAPFTPILSINKKEPSIVKGYIHESLYSKIAAGDPVTVISIDGKKKVKGEVAGLGNRIVPYPVRLLKIATFQLWGREITVKIPESNGLILGEKVTIVFEENPVGGIFSKLFSLLAPDKLSAKEKTGTDTVEIKWDGSVKIEASGAVYLEKENLFAIVSDETEKKSPVIYLTALDGTVKKAAVISGLDKIDDVESICKAGDDEFIVASSLSRNKKGKLRENRQTAAMIKMENGEFRLTARADLYAMLEKFAASADSGLASFIKKGMSEGTLDIEGISAEGNDLLISFKDPLFNDRPLIMKISGFRAMFDSQKIDPAVASHFTVEGIPANERISDILHREGVIHFTASCSSGKCGGFYRYEKGKAVLIKHFDGLKPEGVAFNSSGSFFIFFDEGGKGNSRFTEIKK